MDSDSRRLSPRHSNHSVTRAATGQVIVLPVADSVSLKRMGVDRDQRLNVGHFSQGQRSYLDYHRENVLRMAHVRSTESSAK